MKIDFVAPRFHPSVGGIEEALAQLARGLRARGHEVVVHTTRLEGLTATDEFDGIPIRRYKPTVSMGYYASRFHPDLEGDLVHLHAYAHLTNDWVIRRYAGRRPVLLSTHHGASFPKAGLLGSIYHAGYNRLVGIPNLRRVSKVLVATAHDALYFNDRGVPSERIQVLPSGADEAAFETHAPWFPADLAPAQPFLLYLGRFHAEKGLEELLAAYRDSANPLPLVLAGRDEGMLARLGPLGPKERVHVVSDPTAEQKWALLAACRALVLPSRHEGQGIVVAEAWAQGKPVVATRAGGLPYVVERNVDGLLVDVGDVLALRDAMYRIATDDRLARRLGEAGRRKAGERYRWGPIVATLESIYAGLLP